MTRELAVGSASPHDMKTNQHRPDAFPAGQAPTVGFQTATWNQYQSRSH